VTLERHSRTGIQVRVSTFYFLPSNKDSKLNYFSLVSITNNKVIQTDSSFECQCVHLLNEINLFLTFIAQANKSYLHNLVSQLDIFCHCGIYLNYWILPVDMEYHVMYF
jgi:hypothetical protein